MATHFSSPFLSFKCRTFKSAKSSVVLLAVALSLALMRHAAAGRGRSAARRVADPVDASERAGYGRSGQLEMVNARREGGLT